MRKCACGCGLSLEGQKPSVKYAMRSCAERLTVRSPERGDWTPSERGMIEVLRLDPCAYCGGPAGTIDHIDPIYLEGDRTWDNLTAACRSCNSSKGARPLLMSLLGVSLGSVWRPVRIEMEDEMDNPYPKPGEGLRPVPREEPPRDISEEMIDLVDAVDVAFELAEIFDLPLSALRTQIKMLIEAVDEDDDEPEQYEPPTEPAHVEWLIGLMLSKRHSKDLWEREGERVVSEMESTGCIKAAA